jgi:hypothetical protein
MRRHARAHPLVRRRPSKLLKDLKSKAPSSWPRHFHHSLDHFVGAREQGGRNREAKLFRSFQIDY